MSILHLISQDSFIAVNQKLIDLFGLYEAAIVGLFASVHNYNQITQPNYDGWFYVTYEKMEQKLKLTEDKAAQPIKNLEKVGIIEIKRKGVPCRKYFRFNQDKLLNYLIPSSPPKNGGQETGNSGDKKPEITESSTGKSRGQVRGKTGRNNKTNNNINNNIFISSLEEAKKYFSENNFKSDPDEFFDLWEGRGWKDGKTKIVDRTAYARKWERKHKKMFPEKHKITLNSPNSESVVTLNDPILENIKNSAMFQACQINKLASQHLNFGSIRKTENGFAIDGFNKKAENYREILQKLNIELQLNQ